MPPPGLAPYPVATAVVAVVVAFAAVAWVGGRVLRRAGAVALAGHLAVATVVLPRLPFRWDVVTYHVAALRFLGGVRPHHSRPVRWFAPFQAGLYELFGADPTVLAVVNGLLAVLLVVPVGYLVRRLYPGRDAVDGAVLPVLFLPVPFVFLTVPMRDTLVVVAFFAALALLARADHADSPLALLTMLPLAVLLYGLRDELLVVVVLAGLAGAAVRLVDAAADEPVGLGTLATAAAPVGVVAALVAAPVVPLGWMNGQLAIRSVGDAVYLDGTRYGGVLEVLVVAPVRAVYFQFAPFPTHVDGAFAAVAAAESLVVVVLLVAALVAARRVDHRRPVLALVVTAYLAGVVGYGLVDSNFGTTIRHRIPVVFLLCVVAAPVLTRWLGLLPDPLRRALGVGPDRHDDGEGDDEEPGEVDGGTGPVT